MPLSAKTTRAQLSILKPLLGSASLKTIRKCQNKIGELMEFRQMGQIIVREHDFSRFKGAWVIPKDERRQGVILYLHGGGFTCGDLGYSTGVGSLLAVQTGTRVFCAAYRLAPENPYPAAPDDVLEAYRYLLDKGYDASHITLCGESAGGGLCYTLCLRLRELGLPMPCGIIAISPWTDLTASGESYTLNRDNDPSMTEELLTFFADSYTKDRKNPLVSPLFADLTGMPPSLIFVGGDEIMRSDAEEMHKRLLSAGCKSQLITAPERWHAYVLYGLTEDQKDLSQLNRFLNQVMAQENKLRWLRLDNAAKIYPAARTQDWSNVFRLSATLTETVDMDVMKTALDVTVRRFPSIAVRLRRGVFWYYLEQLTEAPAVREESSYPLTRMCREEIRKCAFRVIVYGRRIAVEMFHSLTDGNGALVFLKSLVAEYLQQKYGVRIPAEHGVLGRLDDPADVELEDSFQKYAGTVSASRQERTAWRLKGTPEAGGFLNVTCFELSTKEVLAKAHEYGVSLTTFLCAAMMMAMQNLQKETVHNPKRRRPLKVLIPVTSRARLTHGGKTGLDFTKKQIVALVVLLVIGIGSAVGYVNYYYNNNSVTKDYSAEEVIEKNHLVHDIIVDKDSNVPADTTLAVIEYAAKPFFGKDTTYTVALYQAKEGASITEKMWSYKKTPASKDETLERIATVTIVTDNKSGDVLSFASNQAT